MYTCGVTAKKNILLMPVGSAGDVHPFVGVGLELKRRGHAVTVLVNGHFHDLLERVGLDQVQSGTDEDFRRVIADPALWSPNFRSFKKVTTMAAHVAMDQFKLIEQRKDDPDFVVVAAPLAFGARTAQEKFNVPLVTLQLAPAVFPSVERPPKLPGFAIPDWSPFWMRRLMWNAGRLIVNVLAPGELHAFRKEVGMPRAKNLIRWWNSPLLTICLIPDWFAMRPNDWPDYVKTTDFPLYDERGANDISPEVEAFLDATAENGGPVVFTPGSANIHGRAFFDTALQSCRTLDRPGMFLTRHPEQIPHDLPDEVRHFAFVPLSQALHRCAALVSHGGIGTIAQGFKGGIPQIAVAMAHDQFDNGHRLEVLGIGRMIRETQFNAQSLTTALSELLDDPSVKRKCEQYTAHYINHDGIAETCDLIEQVN